MAPRTERRVLLVGEVCEIEPLAAWVRLADTVTIVAACVPPRQPDDVSPEASVGRLLFGVDGVRSWLNEIDEATEPGVVVGFEGASMGGEIADIARERGWRIARLPRPEVQLDAPIGVSPTQATGPRLDLASLIGREARAIDESAFRRAVGGKRVLVTGAGGSIGSEIARLVAQHGADAVVLVDRSENALFEIDRHLRERSSTTPRRTILHDVVDAEGTRALLEDTRPHVIFHAAAHKHVPLMEDHPAHAVENNFFGTKSIADAAVSAGVERLVLISSDKAVNPTSVMGATKRLAERYVQGLNRRDDVSTRFTMVRFGNVLGSACSVLPIWSAQLAEGAPMTVTDVRMTRYFMTITEAASLVVQSASLDGLPSESGEIFLLDMGEPVRIIELAERFVRSHGLTPRVVEADAPRRVSDVHESEIVVTGARPGEKLHEELASAAERVRPTPLEGIGAWIGADEAPDLSAMVAAMDGVRQGASREEVVRAIRDWVPEMTRPDDQPVGETAAA